MAAAALGFLTLAAGGCGKPVLRVADASLGDYYTEKEYRRLSDEQRKEYCRELAEQRDTFLGQIADAKEALNAFRLTSASRQREVDSLQALADQLERRIAEGRGQPGRASDEPAGSIDRYVVKEGDSLWLISGRHEVYGKPERWNRLYRANRRRIQDPDRIFPGQEIRIPR